MREAFIMLRLVLLVAMVLLRVAAGDLRGQDLQISWNGREIRIAAPQFHFLAGRALERLRNGSAVAFDFQLSLLAGELPFQRTAERFLVSYDLWEERFAVVRMAREQRPMKSVSHLTQPATEAWCLENLILATDKLDPDRWVTVQLDVRAEDVAESRPLATQSGISLAALIEIFSRTSHPAQSKWTLRRGPIRIADYRKGS